jgi:hypothetical protein
MDNKRMHKEFMTITAQLKTAGFIAESSRGHIRLTDDGHSALCALAAAHNAAVELQWLGKSRVFNSSHDREG